MLVKANASENPQKRLEQKGVTGSDEVRFPWLYIGAVIHRVHQTSTIILAGHETTANSISFALLEMCRKPDMQDRLRKEIRATEQVVHERGDSSFLAN